MTLLDVVPPPVVEVVATSVRSCLAAERGGAKRLELVSAFSSGGTTPSDGMLRVVKRAVALPVFVMIRPREGDFCYDATELDVMRAEIDACAEAGADGFVFGILDDEGRVDTKRARALVARCGAKPCVFHRAFDLTPNREAALEAVIDAGFVRAMTSGGARTAPEGTDAILRTHNEARGRIEIMPGGAITPETFADVMRPEFSSYHLGGRKRVASPMRSDLFEMDYAETAEESVREIVNRLDELRREARLTER